MGKDRLTTKKYKDLKLNMTQHGFNTDFYDAMAKFYSDEDREKRRMIADSEGKCTDTKLGRVVDLGPLEGQYIESKGVTSSKFIWAMDDSGNMYIDYHSEGIFHSAMMGGYRPIAAGEICIADGYIVMLNEDSGHYAPSGRLDLVIQELESQGFRLPNITKVNSKHSNEIKRVSKVEVRTRLIEKRQLIAGLKQEKIALNQ